MNKDDLCNEIELVLCASGYVKGEWTAYEVASIATKAVIDWINNNARESEMTSKFARVTLFKPSGKYYTTEQWYIPEDAIGPYDMDRSPDFRRIDGGAVLVESQEPWGYLHLFPSESEAKIQKVRELHAMTVTVRDGGYDPFAQTRYTVTEKTCKCCGVKWPCLTIRIVDDGDT